MVDGPTVLRGLIIVIAASAIVGLLIYYNARLSCAEGFLPPAEVASGTGAASAASFGPALAAGRGAFAKEEAGSPLAPEHLGPSAAEVPQAASPGGQLRPEDLLPRLGNSPEEKRFELLNPGAGAGLQGMDFLDAGRHISQASPPTRNVSQDLRGEEPILKRNVSPWLMSTIDPDTDSLKHMEIVTKPRA